MYRNILVPVDGSPACEHSLPWAASIAEKDGATLHLVRVHIPPAPVMVGSELAADVGLDATLRSIETKYLDELAARLGAVIKTPVRQALLEGGISDAVQAHAAGVHADLIAMTTHGRGAFARFWLGSVADALMRHATVPTLLIRPHDEKPADLAARLPIQRIVAPLDGSELAEKIVAPIVKLAKTMNAEISLVLVLEAVENIEVIAARKDRIAGGWFPEATEAKADAYLEQMAHRLRGHGLTVHKKLIPHGTAAGPILEYAHTHGNSIIALATHGRGGLRRMLLGSVADKIVRGATMPVLIYHPAQAD